MENDYVFFLRCGGAWDFDTGIIWFLDEFWIMIN